MCQPHPTPTRADGTPCTGPMVKKHATRAAVLACVGGPCYVPVMHLSGSKNRNRHVNQPPGVTMVSTDTLGRDT